MGETVEEFVASCGEEMRGIRRELTALEQAVEDQARDLGCEATIPAIAAALGQELARLRAEVAALRDECLADADRDARVAEAVEEARTAGMPVLVDHATSRT